MKEHKHNKANSVDRYNRCAPYALADLRRYVYQVFRTKGW